MSLFEKDTSDTVTEFKGRVQPTAGSGILLVEGSFDFLEGGFDRAEKFRRSMLTITMVTAAALVGLILLGMYFRSVANNANASAASASTQTAAVVSELAVLDAAGGFTADELRAHAAVRGPVFTAAAAGEVDMVALYSSIVAALPGPMVLNSVSTSTQTAAPAPTASAGATPAPSASPAATSAATTSVTIVSTAPTLEDANVFRDNLARTPGFAALEDPTWTGTQGAWTVTIVATIGEDLFTTRAQEAAIADEFGLPKPTETAPAPATSGSPASTTEGAPAGPAAGGQG